MRLRMHSAPRHAAKFSLPKPPHWAREWVVLLAFAILVAAGASYGVGLPAAMSAHASPASVAQADIQPASLELNAVTALPESPAPTPAPTLAPTAAPALQASASPVATVAVLSIATPGAGVAPSASPVAASLMVSESLKKTVAPKTAASVPAPSAKPARQTTSLLLRVYKGSQCVVAFRENGSSETPVRVMICSTGLKSEFTPEGTFAISDKYDYHQLEGAMGQYCTRFNNGVLFHSIPISNAAKTAALGKNRMIVSYYEKLGKPASLGCVRLLVADARWIYENCPAGTVVEVLSGESPFGTGNKPELLSGRPYTISGGRYGWDPTDPDPKNPYNKLRTASPSPSSQPASTPTPAPAA